MKRVDLGWFNLLWRKITNSAFIWVDFLWMDSNIKFSLKLMQIEITSTLPSVGWMWISICTHLNSNLILLFIHPYPPSKGWVNCYSSYIGYCMVLIVIYGKICYYIVFYGTKGYFMILYGAVCYCMLGGVFIKALALATWNGIEFSSPS